MLLSIKNEELQNIFKDMKTNASTILYSFDTEDSQTLLKHVSKLELSYQKVRLISKKSDPSEFSRHMHFLRHYLEKDKKEDCKKDIFDICINDIPEMEQAMMFINLTSNTYDKEFVKKIDTLLEHGEFDSVIRKSFVILKEKIKKKFNVQEKIDGSDLINKVFGQKGIIVGYIDEDERQALRNLLDGAYGIFRNKYGHNDVAPSWQETEAVISLINWLLIRIDEIRY